LFSGPRPASSNGLPVLRAKACALHRTVGNYADFGEIGRFSKLSEQQHTLFAVTDFKLGVWLVVALLIVQFPIGWFMPDVLRCLVLMNGSFARQ
jgi:hypothetical protein